MIRKINQLKQQGAALITALFITALAAIIATAIMVHQRLLIDQSQALVNYDQLAAYLTGVQDWAVSEIKSSVVSERNGNVVSTGILKHPNFPTTTINGVTLRGKLLDATSLFNLNILRNTIYQPNFIALAHALNVQIPNALPQTISDYLNSEVSDDSQYFKLKPPYRPAHHLMANKTELRAVLGVTQAIYLKLAPYVVALPLTRPAINVNTAPVPVLESVSPKMNGMTAQSIISCRQTTGGISSETELKQCAPELQDVDSKTLGELSYNTQYFIVRAQAEQGDHQLNLVSLLYLSTTQKNLAPKVDVLWQAIM